VAWTSATWTCRAPLDERQGGQEPLRVGEVLARGGVGWLAVHGPDLNSGQGPGLVCRAPAGAAHPVEEISPHCVPVDSQ
jgi:hypothetical protein